MIFTFICLAECKEELVFKYVRPWDLKDIGQTVIVPIVCNKQIFMAYAFELR